MFYKTYVIVILCSTIHHHLHGIIPYVDSLSTNNQSRYLPIEELIRENAYINRLLLIYDELLKKMEKEDVPVQLLTKTVSLIKMFVHDYHEMIEREYVFSFLESYKLEQPLIKTLRTQQEKGAKITARLQQILATENTLEPKIKKEIKSLITKFVTMYRPHLSRLDTQLLPLIQSFIPEVHAKELCKLMHHHAVPHFGSHRFDTLLKRIQECEIELQTHYLEKFTAKI